MKRMTEMIEPFLMDHFKQFCLKMCKASSSFSSTCESKAARKMLIEKCLNILYVSVFTSINVYPVREDTQRINTQSPKTDLVFHDPERNERFSYVSAKQAWRS